MEDEILIKKYIRIIDFIVKNNLLSLSSILGKDNEIENSLEIWNSSDFELENFEFVLFFHKLEERKILEVYLLGSAHVDKEGITKNFYNDETSREDFATVTYGKVDTQKATQYKKELEELLNIKHKELGKSIGGYLTENDENISKKENNKITLLYSEKKGLSLKSNKNLLYSPRKGTDRFYYLKELINKQGKIVSRKHLDSKTKKINKNNLNQNYITSGSISDMNRIIKRNLKLEHDFILGSGYRINIENYKIEITK